MERIQPRGARFGEALTVCGLLVMGGLLLIADVASAATCSWTGAGADNKWSTAANWSCVNPLGGPPLGRGPLNGDALVFPDGAAQPANVDDFAAPLTITTINIAWLGTGAAWDITAVPNALLGLTGNLTATLVPSPTGPAPSFTVPIVLGVATATITATKSGTITGAPLLRVGDININDGELDFVTNDANISVIGHITGNPSASTIAVVKRGFSTLTLNDNSYTGLTIVQGGILMVAGANALGATSTDHSNATEVTGGGSLEFSSDAPGLVLHELLLLDDGATLIPDSGTSVTLAGPLNGHSVPLPVSLSLRGAGTLTIAAPIEGTAPNIVQDGGGTVVFTNAVNQIANYALLGGTLRIGVDNASLTGTLKLEGNPVSSTLDLNNFSLSIGDFAGDATSQVLLGTGTLTIAQNSDQVYAGSFAGAGNIVKGGPFQLTLGGVRGGANTATGTFTVNQGTVMLAKDGTDKALAGQVFVNDGGTLRWAADNQITDTAKVTVNGTGLLDLAGHVDTIGSLAGDGRVEIGTGTLAVGANNTGTAFTGTLHGALAPGQPDPASHYRLIKVGTGSLTLTGMNNALSDDVVVQAGALIVDGRLGTAAVFVKGGLLGGKGAIFDTNAATGTPTVSQIAAQGGNISPSGFGTLTGSVLHGDAAEIDAGSLVIALNGLAPATGTGPGYDQLALTQAFTLASGAGLNVSRGARVSIPKGSTFTIVHLPAGSTTNGTFAGLAEGATMVIGQQHFSITYHGGPGNSDIVLTALDDSPVPTYYLSEGATGDFFHEDILIANPNTTGAPVTLTFSKEDGSQVVATRTVAAQSRMTVHVADIQGLAAVSGVSAQVASTSRVPLVVERSMFWDATYYAGSTGSSVDKPAQDWFFAEGSQGFFFTFILVNNPNPTPADVTFTFFLESGATVTKSITVGATTRLTLYAGDVPQLVNQSFGTSVHASQPIMAERSMYFGTRPDGRIWCGGTESAGVTATSTHWFLAEGATGGFFNTYVLLSNPNDTAANVTVQYLLPDGETVTVQKSLPAHTRKTTNIGTDEPDTRLKNTAVSTVVTSDQPIIAERSMYWPGAIVPFGEGHNSFGVVDAGLKWGLAEGRTGTPLNYHTYILLANPQTTAANVTVTFLRETGAPVVKTFTVAATSRFNIDSATITELHDENFGALIAVTNNVPIIVERSLYWDSNGIAFSGGTNATAIPLP